MPVIGDNIVLTTTFTVDGTPTAPTAVVLTVKAPDGTETTPAVSTSSVGVYTATVPVDQAGEWTYRWVGSGAAVGVDEGTFSVGFSLLDPPAGMLATLAAAKRRLGITGSQRDTEITDAILDASILIAAWCEREFTPSEAEREFPVEEGGHVDLAPYDLREPATVDVDGDAVDYTLHPAPLVNGVATRLTVDRSLAGSTIVIDGEWGFAAVPAPVERACIETVRTMIKRDPGNWSAVDTAGMPEYPESQGTYAIPRSAKAWLDPYKRPVGTIA